MDDADRRPCPICDHPTGDCSHGNHVGLRPLFHEWSSDPLPRPAADVEVLEDLYEDIASPRESRPRRRLVARAGQMIDATTARRLGLMPEGHDNKRRDDTSRKAPPPKPAAPAKERDRDQQPAAPRDRIKRK